MDHADRKGGGSYCWRTPRWLLVTVACVALATISGCQDERADRVDRGVAVAQERFEDAKRNIMATMALQSNLEAGGDPLTYLIASLDENGDYPPFGQQAPSQPWCVVVRQGPDAEEIIIEGYYEDLTHPACTAIVKLNPPSRP